MTKISVPVYHETGKDVNHLDFKELHDLMVVRDKVQRLQAESFTIVFPSTVNNIITDHLESKGYLEKNEVRTFGNPAMTSKVKMILMDLYPEFYFDKITY